MRTVAPWSSLDSSPSRRRLARWCNRGNRVGDTVNRLALATVTFGTSELIDTPSPPKIRKPPAEDPEDTRKRAELAARKRRQRAKGGFSFSDTFITGQSGLGSGASPVGGAPSLIGT